MAYTSLINHMLLNSWTRLKFNNFISDQFPVLNSTTQGCLLLMILYTLYNALLIESVAPGSNSKASVGFVNDIMFLAIASSLEKTHSILQNVMQCLQGGLSWSNNHNSPLKLSKFALMDFPHFHRDTSFTDLYFQFLSSDGMPVIQMVKLVEAYKYFSFIGLLSDRLCSFHQ